jgi:hypothetical protein
VAPRFFYRRINGHRSFTKHTFFGHACSHRLAVTVVRFVTNEKQAKPASRKFRFSFIIIMDHRQTTHYHQPTHHRHTTPHQQTTLATMHMNMNMNGRGGNGAGRGRGLGGRGGRITHTLKPGRVSLVFLGPKSRPSARWLLPQSLNLYVLIINKYLHFTFSFPRSSRRDFGETAPFGIGRRRKYDVSFRYRRDQLIVSATTTFDLSTIDGGLGMSCLVSHLSHPGGWMKRALSTPWIRRSRSDVGCMMHACRICCEESIESNGSIFGTRNLWMAEFIKQQSNAPARRCLLRHFSRLPNSSPPNSIEPTSSPPFRSRPYHRVYTPSYCKKLVLWSGVGGGQQRRGEEVGRRSWPFVRWLSLADVASIFLE